MTRCRYFYVDADLFYFQMTFESRFISVPWLISANKWVYLIKSCVVLQHCSVASLACSSSADVWPLLRYQDLLIMSCELRLGQAHSSCGLKYPVQRCSGVCTAQYSAVVVVLVCTTAAQQQQPVLGWRLSLQLIAVVVTPSVQRESAQGCSCRREADQQSPARARKAAIRKLPPRVSREGKCLRRKKTFSSLKSTNTQVVDNQKLVELRNI